MRHDGTLCCIGRRISDRLCAQRLLGWLSIPHHSAGHEIHRFEDDGGEIALATVGLGGVASVDASKADTRGRRCRIGISLDRRAYCSRSLAFTKGRDETRSKAKYRVPSTNAGMSSTVINISGSVLVISR